MTTLACEDLTRERPAHRSDWRSLATMLPRLLWRAQQRRRDRMVLMTMSEPMLRDIGITRLEADQAAKDIPLWR